MSFSHKKRATKARKRRSPKSNSSQAKRNSRLEPRRNPGRSSRFRESYTHDIVIESAPSSPFSKNRQSEYKDVARSPVPSSIALPSSTSTNNEENEFQSLSTPTKIRAVRSPHRTQGLTNVTNTPHRFTSNVTNDVLLPVQLTSFTELPPHCPTVLNEIDWKIRNLNLRAKELSFEPNFWTELEQGKHLASGLFDIGTIDPGKLNAFFEELVEIGGLNRIAKDGLSITDRRVKKVKNFSFKEMRFKDKRIEDLLRRTFDNFDEYVKEIYEEHDTVISYRIAYHKATVGAAGCITTHWDQDSTLFPWHLRNVFTFGNWVKLFGFTDSVRQNDPFYAKVFKHGDFIVMDRIASGTEERENGTHLHHSATLLPRPDQCEEEELYLCSLVMDMKPRYQGQGTFWPSAYDFVEWMKKKNYA